MEVADRSDIRPALNILKLPGSRVVHFRCSSGFTRQSKEERLKKKPSSLLRSIKISSSFYGAVTKCSVVVHCIHLLAKRASLSSTLSRKKTATELQRSQAFYRLVTKLSLRLAIHMARTGGSLVVLDRRSCDEQVPSDHLIF